MLNRRALAGLAITTGLVVVTPLGAQPADSIAVDAPVPLSDVEGRVLVGRYRNAGNETVVFSLQGGELVLEDETPLRVQRVGSRTLAVLASNGAVALRLVTVPDIVRYHTGLRERRVQAAHRRGRSAAD